MRREIERFFQSYRDAYNSGDPAAIARHIAVPSLMLERAATVWSTEAEVLTSMEQLVALYWRSGFKSADFVVDWLKEQGAKRCRYRHRLDHRAARSAVLAVPYHTGYSLRRNGGTWRIVFCAAYQEPTVRRPG